MPCISSTCHSTRWSAAVVRATFLEFFRQRGHTVVPSSAVLPRNDPTVPFVNAGMNQFKSVLLGERSPPAPAAVNVQKCVRVGGRHSDLGHVGHDGHHHTFFEMLGSWSFNHYFKERACVLAWRLLTEVYELEWRHLYVSYFGGDAQLSLPPDLATRQVWLDIGVPADHIVACGGADNLWEMGESGPCGTCTELHYDQLRRGHSVADRVNKGHADVTELWNIVFMQYNRESDGTLTQLAEHHVDTGMGLERLAAILQRARDNYDTDLFTPLFHVISKTANVAPYGGKYGAEDTCGADTAQRVLADHARMIAVCLSDGVLPHNNHRLRRVIRRVFSVCDARFRSARLPAALVLCSAQSLAPAYPELPLRLDYVQHVLETERHVWLQTSGDVAAAIGSWSRQLPELLQLSAVDTADLSSVPALIEGLKLLRQVAPSGGKCPQLDCTTAIKLHEEYGFTEETLTEVARARAMEFDAGQFRHQLLQVHRQKMGCVPEQQQQQQRSPYTRAGKLLRRLAVPSTDNSGKYSCLTRPVDGSVIALLDASGSVCRRLSTGEHGAVVLSHSGFHGRVDGHCGDYGALTAPDINFQVETVLVSSDSHILHVGRLTRGTLAVSPLESPAAQAAEGCVQVVQCGVDSAWRHRCSQQLTCAHLLVAALRQLWRTAVPLALTVDGERGVCVDVATHDTISEDWAEQCEQLLAQWVTAALTVRVDPVTINDDRGHHLVTGRPDLVWSCHPAQPPAHTGQRVVRISQRSAAGTGAGTNMGSGSGTITNIGTGADTNTNMSTAVGSGTGADETGCDVVRALCSGPHVASTDQLVRVRLMGARSNRSARVRTITAVAGQMALDADRVGAEARAMADRLMVMAEEATAAAASGGGAGAATHTAAATAVTAAATAVTAGGGGAAVTIGDAAAAAASGDGGGAAAVAVCEKRLLRLAKTAPLTDRQYVLRVLERLKHARRSGTKTARVEQLTRQLNSLETGCDTGDVIVHIVPHSVPFHLPLSRLLRRRSHPSVLLFRSDRQVHVRCWLANCFTRPAQNGIGDIAAANGRDWLQSLIADLVTPHPVSQVNWHNDRSAAGVDIGCRKMAAADKQFLLESLADRLRHQLRLLLAQRAQ